MNTVKESTDIPDPAEARKEFIRQKKLARFIEFRTYIDTCPPYELLPWHSNYHLYKCRRGFFTAVRNDIVRLIRDNVITDSQIIKEGAKFIEYTKNGFPLEKTNPLGPIFTTPADIDYINRILDLL